MVALRVSRTHRVAQVQRYGLGGMFPRFSSRSAAQAFWCVLWELIEGKTTGRAHCRLRNVRSAANI